MPTHTTAAANKATASRKPPESPAFAGFTPAAFTFFKNLAKHNERDWFQANKETFEQACRQPFAALTVALDPSHGAGHISRIYRDVRFSKDKSPYHTHISGVVGGHWLQLSAAGLYVGVGLYMPDAPVLRRLRDAIVADGPGRALATLVDKLRAQGYEVGSHESVASAPRGYDAAHPRIELLRMKDIHAGRSLVPAELGSAETVLRIRRVQADLAPFRHWLLDRVGTTSCG